MKRLSILFLCVVALAGLAGCTTAPKLPQEQPWQPIDPFTLTADSEIYGLRVDIYRTPKDANNDIAKALGGPENPASDASKYSWIGVDLGNGLFMDTHNNLSVDLVRLYGLKAPFHIEETILGAFPVKVDFQLTDKTLERKGGGDNLPDVSAEFGKASIELHFTRPDSKATIYSEKDSISFDGHGLLGTNKYALLQHNQYRISRDGFVGSIEYVVKNEDKVDLAKKFIATRKDEKLISFEEESMISGTTRPIQFARTESGCVFSDQAGKVFEIKKEGDTITVSRNSKPVRIYKILDLAPSAQ